MMRIQTRPRPAGSPADAGRTQRRQARVAGILLELRAFIALIVLVIVFGMLSDTFLTWGNLVTMTKHVAINAILAIGMLLVILNGGIDLSVGSIVGLAGVVAGVLLTEGLTVADWVVWLPVWGVIGVTLLVGLLVGAVNGWVVTRFNVAPFIATLGMLYIARGAALLISGGETYPNLQGQAALGNTGFEFLGAGEILTIPTAIWVMALFAGVAAFLTLRTPFGRQNYAVGGNERAAELAGIPVRRVRLRTYMLSGACAAMAGLIIASELRSATPDAGETFELNAIAAVVIGGASLAGGRGTVRGTLVGAFVIGFLSDGLVILGVSTFWQILIKGAVIVLAVILDQSQQKLRRKAAPPATPAVPATATAPAKEP